MRYINKIKRVLFLTLFGLFPVKKNRVFLMSYYGKQTNCNPFAIYTYLKRNARGKYQFVWVDNKGEIEEKTVKYLSVGFYYYLRTSQYIIFNARPNIDIKKRKNQLYIQTWHSSLGFKAIEKDAEETIGKSYVKNAKIDSQYIDLLISGCGFRTECFRRNFWYTGEIGEYGTPRNDCLFGDEAVRLTTETKNDIGIQSNERLILYAPTFRNSGQTELWDASEIDEILEALQKKFGGNWKFALRLHPNVNADLALSKNVVDLSKYADMQHLLLAADILLTDYSSVMFDFAYMKKICFLYCYDYVEYTKNERNTYFSLEELPFGIAKSFVELKDSILNFNNEEYAFQLETFLKKIDCFEDGHASERVFGWMQSHENYENHR